jgi:hypothetical protein
MKFKLSSLIGTSGQVQRGAVTRLVKNRNGDLRGVKRILIITDVQFVMQFVEEIICLTALFKCIKCLSTQVSLLSLLTMI